MGKNNLQVNREQLESTMERTFAAPRDVLWKAHTDKEIIAKWWGPRQFETIVEKYEPRVGGEWKMIHKAEGQEHVFYGEFKEVVEQEKITWTFIYAPYPDSVVTETITFEDEGNGQTRLRTVSHYPSIEALEGMVRSGMEEGATETWDRLEEVVQTLQQ